MTVAERAPRVALAGNPNTGKSTLFNRLTGASAKVGNYPGITVDRHTGRMRLERSGEVELIDVPGTYSLSARSEEEHLAIRAIAGMHPLEQPDAILVVVDATQLARNLYLLLQILELGVPTVVALNMGDLVTRSGHEIDHVGLSRELGVPVVPIVAQKGIGMGPLRLALDDVLVRPETARPGPRWQPDGAVLVEDLAAIETELPESWTRSDSGRARALALWSLLSIHGDDELDDIPPALRARVEERRAAAAAQGREVEEEIIRGRYGWIDEQVPRFLIERRKVSVSATDRIDRLLLHPALGFALFLTAMTVVFQSLFAWADPAIGWIETGIGWLGDTTSGLIPESLFQDFVVSGVIEGVGGVLVFLPQILLLFFFIGLMEDTGYMARVAFLMDRIMKSVGLHGRAFVPMLSGFACAVPAVMATRTMERRRDRMLTMMVVPLMTCSARLPVYGLLIAALYPPDENAPFAQGLLMAAMYLFSTVVALVCAAVLGRTLFKGPQVPLLLEMPPYRMPHWPSVVRMMWQKSSVFVKEAGTVILACTIVMWALLTFPREPELDHDYASERAQVESTLTGEARAARLVELESEESGARLRASYGGRLGIAMEPVIEPLGFDWKIGVGLIGAFAAREVFVSTMAVVYGLDQESDETSTALRDRIRHQEWPDGRRVFTPLVCFSLMVFFALACQCMSTLAAVKRETASYRWPIFLFVYMTALAWVASFVVFQGGQLLGFN